MANKWYFVVIFNTFCLDVDAQGMLFPKKSELESINTNHVETKRQNKVVFSVGLRAGINSTNLFNNKYTADSSSTSGGDFSGVQSQLYKFKFDPNLSYELFGTIRPKIGSVFFIENGIGICRRSFELTRTPESYSTVEFHDLQDYIHIDNFLEIQFGVGLSLKYLNLNGGLIIPILDIPYDKFIYQSGNNTKDKLKTLFIGDNMDISAYFTISGIIQTNKILLEPYLMIDKSPFYSSLYFHVGSYFFLETIN